MSKVELKRADNNIYAQCSEAYIRKGYSAIPDKYASKMPAIKDWTRYCFELPTLEEAKSWSSNFKESNIAIALGEASGIIALDVDTTDQDILDILITELPNSPVEKKGAKGFTRFYKYNHETTQNFSLNKEVIFEVLSNKKKTTIPPSRHAKTGEDYTWTNLSLLDVNKSDLPLLPPFVLDRIMTMIRDIRPEAVRDNFNSMTVSGRNDALVKHCFSLIGKGTELSEAVSELIRFDKENHDNPYFTDIEEYGVNHTDAFTNALKMYSYQLDRLNGEHFKKNEEYETPVINSAINVEYAEMVRLGKSPKQERERKSKRELPLAQGAMGTIQENILANSWTKQPDLAFAASLGLMATLVSRKLIFGNLSPNLYLLNISPSGSGKDAPQQMVKKYLIDIGADHLLGAGDYVSDASLMDGLGTSPVRLDVMDEMGGILKTFTTGGSDYNRKMADVLCELYTSSNTKFLGRATAEGTKGGCYRPNVNILGSTTPAGFSEGVSRTAIEKGLLGRFLVFFGSGKETANRLRKFPGLDIETRNFLKHWANYEAPENHDIQLAGMPQKVLEVSATDSAEKKLDEVFYEFDRIRTNTDPNNPLLPIISRLYQQMIKITLIHSVSRCGKKEPTIDEADIKFGYDTIMYFFERMSIAVNELIFDNKIEKDYTDLLKHIPKFGTKGITKQVLSLKTRSLGKRKREDMLTELLETGEIISDIKQVSGKRSLVYWRVK